MQYTKQLIYLPQEERNLKRTFKSWVNQHHLNNSVYSTQKSYYPYNMDIQDGGWGCAWRCIQMILCQNQVSFEQLFQTYGKRDNLLSIYSNIHPENDRALHALHNAKFAPHDLQSGWAEPFIAYLAIYPFKVHSQLVLVNHYPMNAHAPVEVFEETLTFQHFKQRVIKHFDAKKGLIMIDDGTYALVIFGYIPSISDELHLLIGDPHIINNRVLTGTGIYKIVLDKWGNLLGHSMTPAETSNMMYPSYKYLQFNNKSWMVLFTDN